MGHNGKKNSYQCLNKYARAHVSVCVCVCVRERESSVQGTYGKTPARLPANPE